MKSSNERPEAQVQAPAQTRRRKAFRAPNVTPVGDLSALTGDVIYSFAS